MDDAKSSDQCDEPRVAEPAAQSGTSIDVAAKPSIEILAREGTPAKPVESKKYQLGVLFVHGIGTQSARTTMVEWGDRLVNVIELATDGKVQPIVESARAGGGGEPADAVLLLHSKADADAHAGTDERWLLAEGWWADVFPRMTYGELVSWSVRAAPWSLTLHVAQGYWRANVDPLRRPSAKLIALALGKMLIALLLAPVFIVMLALTLVLGLIPVPRVRSLILGIQSALTGSVGDCLAFVESPMRAALIRTRILEGLKSLDAVCRRTLVVAHSQGAAVVLEALGGFVDADPHVAEKGERARPRLTPNALLTFGAGINQLAGLRVLARGRYKPLGMNPATWGTFAVVASTLGIAHLIAAVSSGRATIASILESLGLMLAGCAALGGVISGMARLPARESKEGRKWLSSKQGQAGLVITMCTIMAAMFWYASQRSLPLGPVSFLLMTALALAASLKVLLQEEFRAIVTSEVRTPPGLDCNRWIDLYASADPVTNGPTRVGNGSALRAVQIWNRGSPLSDHTTYWDNLDGFTLRVARVCAETSESPWLELITADSTVAEARSAARVRVLVVAKLMAAVGWVGVAVAIAFGHLEALPMPFELPGWLPGGATVMLRWAALVIATMLAFTATARLLVIPWRWGVRREQELVVKGNCPAEKWDGTSWIWLLGLMLGPILALALQLSRGQLPNFHALRVDELGDLALFIFSPGLLVALVLFWVWSRAHPKTPPESARDPAVTPPR
jgi:hypothetical protein